MEPIKINARNRAVELIGESRVEELEKSGICLSWKSEYDLKEFILHSENEEQVMDKLNSVFK